MRESIGLLIRVITSGFFIGYGLFTLIYLLLSLVKRNVRLIDRLDLAANRFVSFVGIIYFLSVMTLITVSLVTVSNYQIRWEPLLQVLLWTTITQLLWIEKIRKKRFLRLVFALLLIISFEIYVIVVTSIYRDYLTGGSIKGLFGGITTTEVAIGLTSKTLVFCTLGVIYSWLTDKLKGIKIA